MLESLVNPKRVEKGPWKMFFIGIIYASLSILLVHWFFSNDAVLSEFSGIIVVTFCVMFSLPFMYFIIKREEREDEEIKSFKGVWRAHSDAIYSLMWLFLGFIVAFSIWYIFLQNSTLLNAQVETYCMINSPGNIEGCVSQYEFSQVLTSKTSTSNMRFFSIIENNIYVMIFTLVFSLIFGAGAIFILAWNASVIAAAIGIFSRYEISSVPLGILRYMIHGFPEIAAYFIAALAGGMFGAGILRHGLKDKKVFRVMENSIILIFIAIIILILAALIEVHLTPLLFQ